MTTTIPAGWKLLAKKTCYVLMHDGAVIATLAGPESAENAAIIARMLDAPGVSTVEDEPAAWMEPGIDVPVTNEYRNKTPLRQAKYCVPLYKHAPVHAPAAGDALDAARYRWLRDPRTDVALVLYKRTGYVPADESIPGIGGYHTYEYRAGEELDTVIDAAIAAQRKGGA